MLFAPLINIIFDISTSNDLRISKIYAKNSGKQVLDGDLRLTFTNLIWNQNQALVFRIWQFTLPLQQIPLSYYLVGTYPFDRILQRDMLCSWVFLFNMLLHPSP